MHSEKIINNQIIFYSEYKYNDKQYNIEMLLDSQEFKIFLWKLIDKYNIIIWWDGTMLQAINKYHTNWRKFIWINFWNKWFLLQNKKIILKENNFIDKTYSLFNVEINWKKYWTFVNEINITANWGKIWEFSVKIWDKNNFNIKWDGLIIATPLWSTAYNNSLWWPILSHESNSIVITSKALIQPKNLPSIVLNDNKTIIIKSIWRFHWLGIYLDWQWEEIDTENTEIIIKKSEYKLTLSIWESEWENWENKIFEF